MCYHISLRWPTSGEATSRTRSVYLFLSVCIKVSKFLKISCVLLMKRNKKFVQTVRCVYLRFQKSFLHLLCVCHSVGWVTLLLKLTNLVFLRAICLKSV